MQADATTQICLPVVGFDGVTPATVTDSLRKLAAAATAHLTDAVRDAASKTDPNPTQAQREAGNYRKGKVAVHGLMVSVENPQGSYREGTDRDGNKWRTKMHSAYGYFLDTKGKDKDHVDVFLGPEPECELAFVVDQVDPETGKFDEHKVLIGWQNEAAARAGYLANYEKDWKGCGDVTPMTLPQLKAWLKKPATEPVGRYLL